MNDAQVKFKVIMDDKDASSAIDKLNKKSQSLDQQIQNTAGKFVKAGAIMTAGISTPLFMLGKSMFSAASDFNESLNKVQVAFGDSSKEVEAFAKTTLESFGIAEGSALEMASLFGDMSTSMGLTTQEASKMSMGLVGLAGDLASFKNISIEEAQTALAGVFTGETESLKRLGIVMTETNLEQYALSKGIKTNIKDMTQAEKVQLRYAYVTEMSKNAIGDFERTSDGSANSLRIMQESIKEASTELGQALLPIITPVIQKITELAKWFGGLNDKTKKIIVTVGLFVVAAGPVISIIGGIMSVVTPLIGLISGLGAVFAFIVSPIGLVIAAIAAVIAIGVLLWKNWDTVKEKASQLWSWITDKFEDMANFIENIDWKQIGKDMMNAIWNGLKDIWNSLWNWVSDIGKKISDAFLGKQKEINDFNNQSSAYTGMSVNSVSTSGKAGLVPKVGATQTSSNTSNTVIQNFYSQTVSSTDAYRKKVELSNVY